MEWASIESWIQTAIEIISPWVAFVLCVLKGLQLLKSNKNELQEKIDEFIVSEKKNKDETIEEMRQENDELKLIIDAQQKQIETLTNNQIQLQKDITRVLEKRVD